MRSILSVLIVMLLSSCLVTTSTRGGSRPPPPNEPAPPPGRPQPPPPAPAPRYLEGTVTDATSGKPVGRAAVDVTSPMIKGEMTTQTDENGYYRTKELPPGEFALRCRREGYEAINRTGNITNGPARLDFALTPKRR
jgi:hypothetical protein